MPRVAYITCDTPAWYDIADRMAREEDWQPIYWIADRPSMSMIADRFPGVITHDRLDAYHLISPPALKTSSSPFTFWRGKPFSCKIRQATTRL